MARPRPSRPGHRLRGTKPEPDSARRNAATQRAILAAAARLVRRQGYNRVTIEAIAAEAGAGKQTIYRWWKTKPALFADLLGGSALRKPKPGRESGALLTRLIRLLNELAREIASPLRAQIYAGLMAEAAADPAIAAAVETRLIGAHADRLVVVLKQGRTRGKIRRNADVKMAAEQLIAALWFRSLVGGRKATGRFVGRLVAQALRGLGS
jgi:AcrR family transcriptional regulator